MKRCWMLLAVLAISGVLCAAALWIDQQADTKDTFSVAIRTQVAGAYDDEGLKFTVCVQNYGDSPVSFEENKLVQLQLNRQTYDFHTDAVTVAPRERVLIPVCIPHADLREDGPSNTVTVVSSSEHRSTSTEYTFN